MTEILLGVVILCLLVVIGLQVALLLRKVTVDLSPLQQTLAAVEKTYDRVEKAVRDEIAKNRAEASAAAKQSREELGAALKNVGDSLVKQLGTMQQTTDQRLDKLRETMEQRLGVIQEESGKKLDQVRQESTAGVQKAREEVTAALKTFNESVGKTITDFVNWQRGQFASVMEQLDQTDRIERNPDGEGPHHRRGETQGHPGGQHQESGADAADR